MNRPDLTLPDLVQSSRDAYISKTIKVDTCIIDAKSCNTSLNCELPNFGIDLPIVVIWNSIQIDDISNIFLIYPHLYTLYLDNY